VELVFAPIPNLMQSPTKLPSGIWSASHKKTITTICSCIWGASMAPTLRSQSWNSKRRQTVPTEEPPQCVASKIKCYAPL